MLDEKILNNYYHILMNKLQTGVDRITLSKYKNIKEEDFQIIIRKIKNYSFHFTRYSRRQLGKRNIFTPTIRDKIILKYLSDKLRQKYKIKFASRDSIISQLILILNEDIPYSVFRIDIKSFYNSILIKDVLTKLSQTSLLSLEEHCLAKAALKSFSKGLPQGLSISAVLSEIMMESIDYQLKRLDNREIFYARYVDDIIIIFNGNFYLDPILDKVRNILDKYKLNLNMDKTMPIQNFTQKRDCSFDYLGYNFFHTKDSRVLYLDVVTPKVIKEKEKIKKVFSDFKNYGNFELLQYRLLNLTKTNYIFTVRYKNLYEHYQFIFKYGFNEAYKFINTDNLDSLEKLDNYLKHCIHYYCNDIPNKKKRILFAYSYKRSFISKAYNAYQRFTKGQYIERLLKINSQFRQNDLNNKTMRDLKTMYFNILNFKYE